jgi:hypothetical protein
MKPANRCKPTARQHRTSPIRRGLTQIAIVLAASASMAACADSLTGPATTPTAQFRQPTGHGPSADVLPGEAEAVALQTFFQNDNLSTCRGELVHAVGTVNSFFHITVVDPTKYRIKVHYNTQGNSGVVLANPTVTYKVIETDDFEEQFDATMPTQFMYTTNVHLRRDGEDASVLGVGDDYYLHINMHVKFDETGVPTVLVDNMKTDCR